MSISGRRQQRRRINDAFSRIEPLLSNQSNTESKVSLLRGITRKLSGDDCVHANEAASQTSDRIRLRHHQGRHYDIELLKRLGSKL